MSFEKGKKVVFLIDLKVMKTRNDCEIACDCVKQTVCKRGFTCRPMERNLRQEAHSYPQADIDRYLLSPFTATSVTSNNGLWSP